jgi:hypothetical protein
MSSPESSPKNKFQKLMEIIIDNSQMKMWENAKNEWELSGYEYDKDGTTCRCGQENITHLFEIRNIENGNILEPIGSVCIKRFNNPNLEYKIKLLEWGRDIDFNFGKYKGKNINDIIDDDLSYCKWLINNADFRFKNKTQDKKSKKIIDYIRLKLSF